MTKIEPLVFFPVLILLECLVGVQAWLAYRDSFFTANQMIGKGVAHGLPFIWHFGMWGDIFIISPLVAIAIGAFWPEWSARSLAISLCIGLILGLVFSWSYTLSNTSDAIVQQHKLTPCGWLHLIYMSLCIFVLTELFLFTDRLSGNFLKLSGALLVTHVFLGTHMVFGLIQKVAAFSWYADHPLQSINGWFIIVSVSVIVLLRIYL